MKDYFIYRHIRLDKNEPFYIGLSVSNTKNYRRAYSKHNRNKIWHDIVEKTDYKIEILYETDSISDLEKKEKYFIKLYGKIINNTGCLANIQDGGRIPKTEIDRWKVVLGSGRCVRCINDKNEFESLKEASLHYNIEKSLISRSCTDTNRTAGGLCFEYCENESEEDRIKVTSENRKRHSSGIAIRCKNDGEEFLNMQFAADYYNINRSSISTAFKHNKSTKGLLFEYINEPVIRNKKINLKSEADNLVFDSYKQCADYYGTTSSSIGRYFDGKNVNKLKNIILLKIENEL